MAVLETTNLKKSFRIPGGKPIKVLDGISFSVEPGEKVAIVGRSGAGKSTFLNIIGGLEKPSSGKVRRPGRIGFVFQAYHLMPELTVLENVLLPTMARYCGEKERERAIELIGKVGLGGRLDHLPGELSGGEMQRVALARALVNDPELVLADEPTGNLDLSSAKSICELLKDLSRTEKSAILLVTHDPVVASAAEKVNFLKDGGIVENFRPEADASLVSRRYLEVFG